MIEDLTVAELLDIIEGKNATDWTAAEAMAELRYRIVPNDYVTTEMRGGIRPTHAPSH